jgi:hypothetical protein
MTSSLENCHWMRDSPFQYQTKYDNEVHIVNNINHVQALQPIFKTRSGGDPRSRNALERCEVRVEDDVDGNQCRFVARSLCYHGILHYKFSNIPPF